MENTDMDLNHAQIMGYAAMAKGDLLKPYIYSAPQLGEHEVRISITHCGLCSTDIQAIDDYYRITEYPFVPGHEIVGIVSEVGKKDSKFCEGDRVGVGWQGRACKHCEWCARGAYHLCLDIVDDAVWIPYGGFSSSIAADEDFVYLLPEGMPSEVGAVLMCAGISVFEPLWRLPCTSPLSIGIIGVGGLGHLAIQFAHKLNHEVTAISSSAGKELESKAFGANHFLLTSDTAALDMAAYTFDVLIWTAHGGIDWGDMLQVLKKKGKVILVGFPDISFNPRDLVSHELTICGSFLGTPDGKREMLSFAQVNAIQPLIELMPMARINDAIERVKENKARYRIVLVNE